MMYDKADGARLNTILGKKIFTGGIVYSDDVKEETGLSIQEIIMCWLFDPRNDFQKALHEWREHNTLMNFEEIQGY